MLKKVKINIFSLIIFITLTACQTVTDKIDQKTELEKKELSKWLNKTEEDLKSFYGQPGHQLGNFQKKTLNYHKIASKTLIL